MGEREGEREEGEGERRERGEGEGERREGERGEGEEGERGGRKRGGEEVNTYFVVIASFVEEFGGSSVEQLLNQCPFHHPHSHSRQ